MIYCYLYEMLTLTRTRTRYRNNIAPDSSNFSNTTMTVIRTCFVILRCYTIWPYESRTNSSPHVVGSSFAAGMRRWEVGLPY